MDVSGILTQVRSGGFINPLSFQMNLGLTSFMPKSVDELTALATDQAALTGLAIPDSGQLQRAVASINNAMLSTQNMLGHSNKLSGVDMSSDVFHVVAKTVNAAKTITGEKSCDNVLAAFGTLQNATAILADTVATIKSMESFLKNIPGMITQIPSILESYSNMLTKQVIADVAVLSQARLVLMQNAVAQSLVALIGDPCVGAVLAGVMTEPLKFEVAKAASEILSKKLITIKK